MINPDKYIRGAYIPALSAALGVPGYDRAVPKDTVPLPEKYFLIDNQSKDPFSRDKCGSEWLCRLTIKLCSVNEKGFNSTAEVDDMEQQAITAIDAGIVVPGFDNKFTRFVDSVSLPLETPTNTISQKVIVYEHWLNSPL